MERTTHNGWAVMAVVVMVGCMVSNAEATDFPTSGGSYVTNVAYRVDPLGNPLSTASAVYNGTSSGDSPSNANNYSQTPWWYITGLSSPNNSATLTVTLDKAYSLNRIRTDLTPFSAVTAYTYQVRLSPDNATWTTVVNPTNIPSTRFEDTFAATNAQYIEWTVWGADGNNALYFSEMQAFAASSAPSPQKEEGYNIAVTPAGSVKSESGWQGWGPAANAIDGWMTTDGAAPLPGATAVYDLGDSYWLNVIRVGTYASWDSGKIEISNDESTWVTIMDGVLSTATFAFDPTLARYVRVTGTAGGGNGHLRELSVYATEEPVVIPEPATMALLAVGGLAALVRRRRA